MPLFDEPSRKPLPQPTAEDVAFVSGKAVLSLLTMGVGSELVALLASPVAQRRDEWWADLERRLRDLEKRIDGFHLEDLRSNPQFVSTTLQATQEALRTHEKEKLETLQNVVLNVALGKELSIERQSIFLALVERLTVLHFAVLRLFHDPARYFQSIGVPIPTVDIGTKLLASDYVRAAMPDLIDKIKSPADRPGSVFQLVEVILGDLVSAKLITLDVHNNTWVVPRFGGMPSRSAVSPITTHLGEDFLAFISPP